MVGYQLGVSDKYNISFIKYTHELKKSVNYVNKGSFHQWK